MPCGTRRSLLSVRSLSRPVGTHARAAQRCPRSATRAGHAPDRSRTARVVSTWMEPALDLVVPHYLWRTGSASPQNALVVVAIRRFQQRHDFKGRGPGYALRDAKERGPVPIILGVHDGEWTGKRHRPASSRMSPFVCRIRRDVRAGGSRGSEQLMGLDLESLGEGVEVSGPRNCPTVQVMPHMGSAELGVTAEKIGGLPCRLAQ